MSEFSGESFAEKRRRFRAEKGLPLDDDTPKKATPKPADTPKVDADLIPEVFERSESDTLIDATLDKIGILEAYQKWCGKEIDASTLGRREGVMVSCPKPDHRDSHPSAWLNVDKNTWYCGGCTEGGDMFDIAAYNKGFAVPGYKVGAEFHKLREQMAADFGTHVKRGANFEETVWIEPGTKADAIIPDPDTKTEAEAADNVEPNVTKIGANPTGPAKAENLSEQVEQPDPTVAAVRLLHPEDDEDEGDLTIYPTLDLSDIIRPNTFLYEYVKACSVDDVPEEYHFWNGMLALGHTAGRRVTLRDRPDVVGNLMMVILGRTGTGKSKARRYLEQIMTEVHPFTDHGFYTSGVKKPPPPGSGEHLIDQFCHIAEDPNALSNPNPKAAAAIPKVYTPVNGMVNIDEFSTIMKITARAGNTLEPTILGMADAKTEVSTGSRTHGDSVAFKPFCSITSSSQPQNLAGLITKEHASGGFLNRWIFVTGEEKTKDVFGSDEVNLARSIDSLKAVKAFCGTDRRITIDHELMPEVVEWFQTKVIARQKQDSTFLLARLDLVMKKMMLLLAINAGETSVSRDTFERTKLLLPYLINCYVLVHAQVGVGKAFEMAEVIEHAIKSIEHATGKPASMRDINRRIARRKYPQEQVNRIIAELVKGERIEEYKPPAGARGRPTLKYGIAVPS